MHKFGFFGLLFILLTFFSCSTEYKIVDSVESISLTADSSIKIIGETITFTVTTNNGTNVTEESKIFVNGTEIEENTFFVKCYWNFYCSSRILWCPFRTC